jgi:hypothetical protein
VHHHGHYFYGSSGEGARNNFFLKKGLPELLIHYKNIITLWRGSSVG